MRKLKLDLEHLAVESFEVQGAEGRTGTVHGQLLATDPRVCETDNTCMSLQFSNCASCNQTCAGTCVGDYTCDALATCDPWACTSNGDPRNSDCYHECTADWSCGTW